MKPIVIIGAGLFGSMAATLCRARGASVTVVDAGHPNAASKASGCVLKPSWLASLTDEQKENGFQLLRDLYDVEDRVLQTNLLVKLPVQHINPDKILIPADVQEQVLSVSDGKVTLASGTILKGRVLVAAGVWSQELIEDMPNIRGLWGASVRYKNPPDWSVDRLHVYAPYRQAVALRIGGKKGSVWFGDGTALVEKSWNTQTRGAASLERARDLFGLVGGKLTVGVRPYVEGHKAGYFRRVTPNTWVSTGGAKNGTLLAAAQAVQFAEEAL
jgi:glycine/D-amino acid oxidase-like deaminating enzyme